MSADALTVLQHQLQARLQLLRDAALWKLEGLDEYDLRRPLTPTGTNLLGLVKHLAGVELDYFGDTFGRPIDIATPWRGSDDDADLWATAAESVADIVALYRRSWAHAQETFDASTLTTTGTVPWWPPEKRDVTLGLVLVHMITETARHVGQMDILREEIDGAAGMYETNDNLSHADQSARDQYVARLQSVADAVKGRS
ncbi:DinB family protein [Williamsia herbipolensis]|uniref:DinB family protein n=1 Tax=Williamsia herbipolensis TaxID=1603258 RepID=A0AAU4JY65_9NOCA|nr:DinB family protein [Williamsia herbipolensis]